MMTDEQKTELAEALSDVCESELRHGRPVISPTFTDGLRWPSAKVFRSFVLGFEQCSYRGLYVVLGTGHVDEQMYVLGQQFRQNYARVTPSIRSMSKDEYQEIWRSMESE